MTDLLIHENGMQDVPLHRPPYLPSTNRFVGPSFETDISRIGEGPLGSKVEALLSLSQLVRRHDAALEGSGMRLSIPRMHVVATDHYDRFMAHNGLRDIPLGQLEDRDIAARFHQAFLPAELVSQLYDFLETHRAPLAVRTSRLTPVPLSHATSSTPHHKMIPNHEPTLEERVNTLQDAIKLMYATSCFRGRREHLECMGIDTMEDKTAILIQEVVGGRYGDRFYPAISGSSYSCDFYGCRGNSFTDGSAALLFGLGQGKNPDLLRPWCYSHKTPSASLPFNSSRHRLSSTQTRFFAIDMGGKGNDPLDVFEYITEGTIEDAEKHPVFPLLVSTYDAQNDRFVPGTGNPGARVLDYAPLLVLREAPFNDALDGLRRAIEETLHRKVAIDFAVSTSKDEGLHVHVLQVTPLFSQVSRIRVSDEQLQESDALIASENALGNGVALDIADIVYIDPETFTTDHGARAAREVEAINRKLTQEHRRYIFIGMGRIGTSDPFRGLPVSWHQIAGARVFIETDLPDVTTDFSHGNHFFSDLMSCGSFYLYVPRRGARRLDFEKLGRMPLVEQGKYVRYVRSPQPLQVMVDGRTRRGLIRQDSGTL